MQCGVIVMSSWELCGLAVDAFIVYIVHRLYKNQVKDADLIMVSQLSLVCCLILLTFLKSGKVDQIVNTGNSYRIGILEVVL